MKYTTPEAQRTLTTMLDRWTGLLSTMGVERFSQDTPSQIALRGRWPRRDSEIVLNAPHRTLMHPDPIRRDDLGYTNEITATQVIDGVSHTLFVNSSAEPHVLASRGQELVQPLTTAQAMMQLCLKGVVVQQEG